MSFAVVFLASDDFERVKASTENKPRVRRNIILELGYFAGRLGQNKVCGLLKGDIEIPMDYVDTVYVRRDDVGV